MQNDDLQTDYIHPKFAQIYFLQLRDLDWGAAAAQLQKLLRCFLMSLDKSIAGPVSFT